MDYLADYLFIQLMYEMTLRKQFSRRRFLAHTFAQEQYTNPARQNIEHKHIPQSHTDTQGR